MIPKSFSATSLQVAALCMARYKAEYVDYGRNFQGSAANVGIVCHGTLEEYVRAIYVRKDQTWDEDFFWKLFDEEFEKVFGADKSIFEYEDARGCLERWLRYETREARLEDVKVLSLESKATFMIKTSAGELPVNYIMDRLEQVSDDVYRIVDYKTNRVGLNPSQLKKKLQARLYALAVQIKYPKASRILVEFDYLRHLPVGVEFTRDENAETWRMLKRATQLIIDTPENRVPETLNSECGWCVRKASCKTLQSHIEVGGILGKTDEQLAEIYELISAQQNGQARLIEEIENYFLTKVIEADALEIDLENAVVSATARSRRTPNHAAIAAILGPELSGEIATYRVSDVDRLVKGKRVDPTQAKLLELAMPKEMGDPSIKIEMKDPS